MSSFDLSNPDKPKIIKDPDATLDYIIDLTGWLADITDSLSSLVVTGVGVTIDSSNIDGDICVAWVSGGTVGETATVTYRFTTLGGRGDDRTIYLKIKER